MRELLCLVVLVASACRAPGDATPTDRPVPVAPGVAEPVSLEPTAGSAALRDALVDLGARPPVSARGFLDAATPHLPQVHADCLAGSELACWMYDYHYEALVAAARQLGPEGSPLTGPCQQGNQVACAAAGEALDDPSGTGGDPIRAIGELMRACRAGLVDACVRAALIRIGSGLEAPALALTEAEAAAAPACERGLLVGCREVLRGLGAITRDDYDLTARYPAEVRVCAMGDAGACTSLLQLLTPEPPFGCDLCDPTSEDHVRKDGEYDERCVDCEIAACRVEHCCSTCADRNRFACCGDEPVTAHPAKAPPLDGDTATRLLAAARRGTRHARALWRAGCDAGYPAMCLTDALDAELAKLEGVLATRTAAR